MRYNSCLVVSCTSCLKTLIPLDKVLDEKIGFEVRWAIAGKSIVTQLVAKLNEGQYMAFGLSGEPDRSRYDIYLKKELIQALFACPIDTFDNLFVIKMMNYRCRMVGGDVTVTWMDHE